jgi:hypothetical protein
MNDPREADALRRPSGLIVPDHAVDIAIETRGELKPGEVQVLPPPEKKKLVTGSSHEFALEKLLDKLEAWLLNQPEWADLMGNGDRQTRRRTAEAMAKYLTTIPAREGQVVNRKMRRNIVRAMKGGET